MQRRARAESVSASIDHYSTNATQWGAIGEMLVHAVVIEPGAALFDHLVGAGEQRRRHLDAERPGGLEVDNEIILGRLLDRDVAGLRPAQNPVGIVGGAPEQVRVVWSVGHQTSRLDVFPNAVNRRQSRGEGQGVDSDAVSGG